MRDKEIKTFAEEVDSILAECQQSVDAAFQQYEIEVSTALKEFHENLNETPHTWVH